MNNGGWKPSASRDFYLNEWTNPKDLHRNYSLFIFHYSFAVCRSQTDKPQFAIPAARHSTYMIHAFSVFVKGRGCFFAVPSPTGRTETVRLRRLDKATWVCYNIGRIGRIFSRPSRKAPCFFEFHQKAGSSGNIRPSDCDCMGRAKTSERIRVCQIFGNTQSTCTI